jgi:succinate dehydrogenase/fumarate reductase flavoprotein subunit
MPSKAKTLRSAAARRFTTVIRVDAGGGPIPGLYAAGTDMASVMGGHYPAGGINLGPAMTFGYIAGRHAAGATGYKHENQAPRAKEHER